jgi:hypothetical protein
LNPIAFRLAQVLVAEIRPTTIYISSIAVR